MTLTKAEQDEMVACLEWAACLAEQRRNKTKSLQNPVFDDWLERCNTALARALSLNIGPHEDGNWIAFKSNWPCDTCGVPWCRLHDGDTEVHEAQGAQGAHYQTHSAKGAQPTTLQELFNAMRANDPNLPEWHNLPTFGGPDIENTTGIWSWDATHYIEGTCADDLQVVARAEGGE